MVPLLKLRQLTFFLSHIKIILSTIVHLSSSEGSSRYPQWHKLWAKRIKRYAFFFSLVLSRKRKRLLVTTKRLIIRVFNEWWEQNTWTTNINSNNNIGGIRKWYEYLTAQRPFFAWSSLVPQNRKVIPYFLVGSFIGNIFKASQNILTLYIGANRKYGAWHCVFVTP